MSRNRDPKCPLKRATEILDFVIGRRASNPRRLRPIDKLLASDRRLGAKIMNRRTNQNRIVADKDARPLRVYQTSPRFIRQEPQALRDEKELRIQVKELHVLDDSTDFPPRLKNMEQEFPRPAVIAKPVPRNHPSSAF